MPIEKKSDELLQLAASTNASDIHFVPLREKGLIQFRVDGRLHQVEELPYGFFERLLSHFKFKAGMDIGERRRPQDGSMDIALQDRLLHLRLSTLPTAFHESLVIRLLPQTHPAEFQSLALFPDSLKGLHALLHRASGLILFSGPTGSGKTTIMYSLLQHIQSLSTRNILTLEDPIEKKIDLFLQMEVNEKAGITYGEGFKSILRHDPDVIMIGEIRDQTTAKLVIRAGMTGHLVLSTVHAEDALGCLYRLIEFGVTVQELEQTLLGIVAQRLLSVSCPYCGEACETQCFIRRKNKRMGIYELLSGSGLEKGIEWVRGNSDRPDETRTLNHFIKQGIALGFLPSQSLERWGVDRL
ncbi:competence type IV pilus ATPase ComGA [Fictibacillus terranigra]|uniref:Competence type IV pilus ATPase ComGA n=1 Tax=Fictibacillus terranigra TaxID=3058424 RepID=A0ABT8EA16_9BACL|nr:competence type IV pilus ATPase ComGA [Fictibacillus sp. CENA-BCM004]MDN4074735.1 competence type IV pilus ATPase ComGA [Fictibacillus sp. CENA-BCM004]